MATIASLIAAAPGPSEQLNLAIVEQLLGMINLWVGTDIESGMRRRRRAEARLIAGVGKVS